MRTIEALYKEHKGNPVIIGTLNYTTDLARETGADISNWDYLKVFSGDGQGSLTHSEREINKRFFSHIKGIPVVQSNPDLTTAQLADIGKLEKHYSQNSNKVIDSNIKSKLASVQDYSEAIHQCQKDLAKLYLQKQNHVTTLGASIQGILSLGFFKWLHWSKGDGNITGTMLGFVTNPVTLNYTRKDGKKYRLDMGQYEIRLYPEAYLAQIYPSKDNVYLEGSSGHKFYHPFVSHRGAICFGTAQEVASKKISDQKFVDYMKLVQSLLTSYTTGVNPYVSLEAFYFGGVRNGEMAPWLDPKDRLTREDGTRLGIRNEAAFLPDNNDMSEGERVCGNCEGSHLTEDCETPHYCDHCDAWTDHESSDCDSREEP